MPLGGSSKLLKALNEAAALGHLLDHGQLTRAELRALTGLSKPTVSEAVRRLADADLVVGAGHETGRPGPNAEVYAVNPDAAYAVAMSVRDGAPSLTASLHDLRGVQRARLAVPTDFTRTDPATAVSATIDALCAAAGVGRGPVAHVQLAVAGAVDPRDRVIHHVDVPGWSRRGLLDDLTTAAAVPVEVDNDVNLAALAERAHGAAQGLPDGDGFVLLWLGDAGLGLAIDLGGGRLLRGARGGAGEIGYMPVTVDGARDLHDLVSGEAVRALAAQHGTDPTDRLTDNALLAELAGRIVLGLAAVVAVLDPPLVVLGGEIGRAGGAALGEAVAKAMSRAAPLETEIAVSTVEDDAPLLGAADAALSAVRRVLLDRLRQPGA
ncbi:ROK family transcriptional regulator [Dactylosporangium aurantiacum]|uniref:ROK family transcriptional regulator n=1 Tax=Dactylosporangium aurantiacum TaxID=35754 RepID=A0A9Q9MDM8_9ACTN|nr:ROK family transcriptional regulator [Dactylosporangium aurantiacum]MDG6106515.1 ROK family transcriptional regulator [Dactylosporangium aurantiacum]UWZ50455.1 ROK family transcriptional regulator [Dactylosporangium aurantiacum]